MTEPSRPPGLIQRYREELQARHYARRTVDTYEQWLRRFLRFHKRRHPREMGSVEVNAFLTHLAVEGQVSASTQNQALSALLFLYRDLLERDLDLEGVVRARQKRRLPVVLTPAEVRALLERMDGVEASLRLHVKDLDFERRELTVRDGKGGKDRRTMLPLGVGERLREQLQKVKHLHEQDLADGYGRVQLPRALSRKYRNADREWNWQWVFPQHQRWRNAQTGEQGRHHLDPSLVQKAIRRAVLAAKISKCATSHSFRHYTHVLNRGPYGISSPADSL
jgi:integron integrase